MTTNATLQRDDPAFCPACLARIHPHTGACRCSD